jgi:hypothetical protein
MTLRLRRMPETRKSIKPLGVAVALGLLAGGLMITGAGFAQADLEADLCDLPASGHRIQSEQSSCLSVSAELDRAPAVGERATLRYSVTAAVDRQDVQLSIELPPNLRWQTVPTGATETSRESVAPHSKGTVRRAELTRTLTARQPQELTGVVEAIAPGPTEIQARATVARSYGTDAGGDEVLLTVANAGEQSEFGIRTATDSRALDYAGARPEVDQVPTKQMTNEPAPTEKAPRMGGDGIAATSCATGSWNYTDPVSGIGRAARQWKLEAWDDDAQSSDDLLATGVTGFDGTYFLCFTSEESDGSTQDVYMRFTADNGNWRVQGPGGVYNYTSGKQSNVPAGGTHNFGWLQPGDPTHMRGANAFHAVSEAWNGTPGACWDLLSSCRPVVVNWAPGSTDGTFYSRSGNDVHLAAADPDSRHIVIHEAAHSIMDDVYDDNMPSAPNCNPHFIQSVSSTGCAWTEGFADWFPLQILGDTSFRWPNGASLNLETPTSGTPGWSNGPSVEGRVAGSLLDLVDNRNDGLDTYTEPMSAVWTTFQRHNSTTFRVFWTDRGNDGFNVGQAPLNALNRNTIFF